MNKLKDKKAAQYVGIGLSLGAGFGIVFGDAIFGDVGTGLALGAGIGLTFGAAFSAGSKKKNDNEDISD